MNLINVFFKSPIFFLIPFCQTVLPQTVYNSPCNIGSTVDWPIDGVCYTANKVTAFSNHINPPSCNGSNRDDGWISFTGDGNTITLEYAPVNRDAIIHLYEGLAPCTLTEIDCSDNGNNGVSEVITLSPSILGQNYLVRIERKSSNNNMNGCFSLTSSTTSGISNCSNAIRVNCGDELIGQSTIGAIDTEDNWSCSTIAGNNNTPGEDQFYVFEWPNAGTAGIIRITLSNTSDDDNPFIELISLGDNCAPAACIEYDQFDTGVDDFTQINVPAGIADYYFVIDSQLGSYDSYDIKFECFSNGISLDSNNNCSPIPNTAAVNAGYYQTWDGNEPPISANAPSLAIGGPYTICENIYIQNPNSYEWLKEFEITLGDCWINPTNLVPNGNDTQQNSGNDTGDWDANIITGTPTKLNWYFTHDDVAEWGDGTGGFYTCFLYTFCYDAEVDISCIEDNGFQNTISASDDGIGAGNTVTNPGNITVNSTSQTTLPVTLISFTANSENVNDICKVRLNWKTSSEINNDYFSLQRSKNGLDFDEIIRVQGNGNSSNINSYTFVDENPFRGNNFYRLKQFDFDGNFETFNAINALNCYSNDHLNTYPNPFKKLLQLELSDNYIFPLNLEVHDCFGRIVHHAEIESNKTTINLESLAAGSYFFILTSGITNNDPVFHKVLKVD